MVRKKVTNSTVDESDKDHNVKKNKKKSARMDDDEYMVAEEIIEDTSVLLESNASVGTNGKQRVETTEAEDINCHNNIEKMKSKKQTTKNGDYNVNETLRAFSGTGGDSVEISNKKDKKVKKNFKLEDDEYVLEEETSIHAPDAVGPPPEEEEVPVAFSGKKKAKKNKDIKKSEETEERTADLDSSNALSTAPDVFAHTDDSKLQATSTRNQGKGRRVEGFELLEEESENTSTELSKPSVSNAIVESEHLDGNYENELQFAGKKMGKKPKKSASAQFSDFDELEAILAQVDGEDSERNGSFDLHVNEKQTSAQVSTHSSLELNDGEVIQFTGKKKGKKGKSIVSKVRGDDDDYAVLPEVEVLKRVEEPSTVEVVPFKEEMPLGNAAGEDVAATSKKKPKKGKKGGRTVQEEDDLDAILAELDGPKFEKSVDTDKTRVPDNYEQPAPSEDVEGTNFTSVSGLTEVEKVAESAAAKKKKKKKEKEKAKSSVLETVHGDADVQEQKDQHDEPAKSKVADKKVPKHVREMQERLAKMKEAEEKRKREEGEKRKKEEEEQQRLDELERQKEEAKRRRKEREKEKLQQKKLEGKLLTGKQKEEARRLTMMREQFLAQKGISGEGELVPKKEVAIPKKPKYDTKKKKRLLLADAVPSEDAVSQADDAQEPELLAADVVDDAVTESISEEAEEVARDEKMDSVEEEEEEEEDWDAKSWEENINLPVIKSAFAEEEENFTKPSSKTGKQAKFIFIQPSVAVTPASPSTHASLTTKYLQQKTSQSTVEPASEDETESEDDTEFRRHRDAKEKREARKADALNKRSADDLRSPICCILGHVDTGKTKLLDCIRRTNVQEGEAGGITQQIGATYFPMDNIKERTKELKADAKLRVPGLLVIDTPGHESFTNLRARGSSLCDIAILVIDVMHGLEPQTIESLNLLKLRQTPFVVALNKVDRLYGWKPCIGAPIRVALKQQNKDVVSEFDMRLSQIVAQLKEQGMNSELYYRNKELRKYISIVPTSAISGEGIPDLLMLLVQLTQKLMEDKLMYVSELQCTVLEVKVVEGLGTTIDLVLVNGVLHEGDQIVVCGMQGPIVTTIRALLTPHPMKELRVKGTYQHHKELKAAQGLKIMAQGLEHAIAGTQLYVVGPDDELEDIKEEAMQDMKTVMSRVDKSGEGVCVQASTLGSLEALLEFLKSPAVKIPVSGISIGPVHKKDVMRASVMLEKKKKEYATILAFDVKVTSEAKELAEELGVKIFMADIIYHLFDQFTAYMNNVKEDKRKGAAEEAVFPCVLKIVPLHIFNKKDPIVVGVDVLEGIAKVGTPLCVPSRDNIDIGRIASLEINRKVVETAKKGQSVAMKIVGTNAEETQKMFGRHFDEDDELVSRITRNSIDLLKENYRDDLTIEEWRLVVKLKKLFEIA